MGFRKVTKVDNGKVEIEFSIDKAKFDAELGKVFKKRAARMAVPGFRKGKAPRSIIEKMYGKGVFYEDAINNLLPEAYEDAAKESGAELVSRPEFEIVSVGDGDVELKATAFVKPEVEVKDYKGIKADKIVTPVTDEMVDAEIQRVRERNARLVDVTDRAAEMGDTVKIDFDGYVDDKQFDGGKGEDYSLKLGSGTFIPGFEEQLVGAKAGDEKELNITFPEDYVPDLAGKSVVFKVKVKEVKEPQAPEVDDEFAKDVSEFETLADFKKDLGEKLQQRRTAEAQNDFESAVLDQLIDNLEADIPDGMVETQLDKIMDEYAMRMSGQGMSMDDYLKMMGMTPEMLRTSAKPSALRQVKTQLALEAVAAAENMEVTEEECEAEVSKLAEQYKLTPEQVKAAVSVDALKQDLLLQKASKLVVDEAKVGEAPKKEEAAAEEKPKKAPAKKAAKKEEKEAE